MKAPVPRIIELAEDTQWAQRAAFTVTDLFWSRRDARPSLHSLLKGHNTHGLDSRQNTYTVLRLHMNPATRIKVPYNWKSIIWGVLSTTVC